MRPPTLRKNGDFRRLLAEGCRARHGSVQVVVAPSTPQQASRLAVAVRGAGRSAVARNRVRRRLRAAWMTCAPRLGFDVLVRAEAPGPDFHILVTDLRSALARCGAVA